MARFTLCVFSYNYKINTSPPTHHVVLVPAGQDQGVCPVIAPAVDARDVRPMHSRLADLRKPPRYEWHHLGQRRSPRPPGCRPHRQRPDSPSERGAPVTRPSSPTARAPPARAGAGGPRRRGPWAAGPACRYLDSEAPHGAHGDARDGSVVVGGHDGALLGAAHTRHALSAPGTEGRAA